MKFGKWMAPAVAAIAIGMAGSANAASLGSLLGVDSSVIDVSETVSELVGSGIDINIVSPGGSTSSGSSVSSSSASGGSSCGGKVATPPSCGGGVPSCGGGVGGSLSPTSITLAITINITINIDIDLDIDVSAPPVGSACRCVCAGF